MRRDEHRLWSQVKKKNAEPDGIFIKDIFFFFRPVYRSNLDILSILLDREADANTRDDMGFTALQIAILCRKRDAAIMLIERGSDMSVVTPLTKASIGELCRTCMPKILRCLEPETSQE